MRKLIYAINLTIDSVCDHTKLIPDEDVFAYFTQLVRDAGAFLYGRKTYELMVPYWPDVAKNQPGEEGPGNEYARAFVAVESMVVCTTSRGKVEGENTRIINKNLPDEIIKLKQESGKYILTGGVSIPSQLAALGLIDEYRFVVHPIVAGGGRRLFEGINLQENLRLKLIESKEFKSGAFMHRYLTL